jgi:hypothetical protein
MSRRIDELGNRYGRLTVIKDLGSGYWLCKCKCGGTTKTRGYSLRKGGTRSCGCLRYSNGSPVRITTKCPIKGDIVSLNKISERSGVSRNTINSRYYKGLRGVGLITMQVVANANRGNEEWQSLGDKPRGM